MECYYCHTFNRKFYCKNCLSEKLRDHNVEQRSTAAERDKAIGRAEAFLMRASTIQALLAEKNRRAMQLEHLARGKRCIKSECAAYAQRIQELRSQIEQKKLALDDAEHRIEEAMNVQSAAWPKEIGNLKKSWHRTHQMTAATRRILVDEVASLFELKFGVVEAEDVEEAKSPNELALSMPFSKPTSMAKERSSREDLYICGVTLPARLVDVSRYPKEELNASIGHVVHMLGLIVRYLGIKLPFTLFQKDSYPYIRLASSATRIWQNTSKMPLFWDNDKNLRRFVIGMAMLNYNIAYLCYTQGVEIPLSQVANTLQGLMACCRAPQLGIYSHALTYKGISNLDFSLDFQQALRLTALRYRSGVPATGKSVGTDLQLRKGLNGSYYKVRRAEDRGTSNFGLSDSDDEDDEDEGEDGALEAEEEEEADEGEEESEQTSGSENWNLVDVMPSFAGRPNGDGESLFQLGASIMPGVLGMMESLGGRHMMPSGSSQEQGLGLLRRKRPTS